MARVNYVIATWSGSRYNPARDYLKVHLKHLFELKHNLTQITVVRPLGSDNEDYYELPEYIRKKVVIINRPANDRSYGQFIFAHQVFKGQFDYQIIAEDDYIPNIDNFDTILVDLINKKGCDYLCGKYARQSKNDRNRAIQNQGIVKCQSFDNLLAAIPNPAFPVMGPEDGTEQLIFSEYFTDNGMRIADYSNEYSVPYWTKTMTYFTKNKSWKTIFVPYQCLSGNLPQHFLSHIQHTPMTKKYASFLSQTMSYYSNKIINTEGVFVIIDPQINLYPFAEDEVPLGIFRLKRDYGKLYIEVFLHKNYAELLLLVNILERIAWENRSENMHFKINEHTDLYRHLKGLNWEKTPSQNIDNETEIEIFKDYRNW